MNEEIAPKILETELSMLYIYTKMGFCGDSLKQVIFGKQKKICINCFKT